MWGYAIHVWNWCVEGQYGHPSFGWNSQGLRIAVLGFELNIGVCSDKRGIIVILSLIFFKKL